MQSRYNHAMRLETSRKSSPLLPWFGLIFVLLCAPGCTFYGEHPARALSDATGGEGLERVFWKDVRSAKWVEVERSLASNYTGISPAGTFDRDATIERYHQWELKDFSIGDLKTELNGNTVVVTYTITLNGTVKGNAGARTGVSEPLPSTPQRMMTVWQQQKKAWVAIAHSVSEP